MFRLNMSNATNMDNGAMDDSSAIDKSLAALFFYLGLALERFQPLH